MTIDAAAPGEMTDLEITRVCAAAMGLSEFVNPDARASMPVPPCLLVLDDSLRVLYDPLHDDARQLYT